MTNENELTAAPEAKPTKKSGPSLVIEYALAIAVASMILVMAGAVVIRVLRWALQ